MKRLLIFLALLSLTVLFFACQAPAQTGEETTAAPSATTEGTAADTSTEETSTEADTTYEDIVYDTVPVVQEKGEPLEIAWNPYLVSPLVDERYRKAFADTIHALLNRRLTVSFATEDELYAVRDNLFYEFPPSALAEWEADSKTLTLTFTYRDDRKTYLEKLGSFGELIENIIRSTLVYGDGEAEKAILLYHYVSHTVSYFKTDFADWQTNAYYALTEHKGICYSFTDAYNYLLRQVGVDALLVKGVRALDRAPHGWSLVKVENAYYHCDTTWESSTLSGVGFFNFGMNDTRRKSAIALSEATVGEGNLKSALTLKATGKQFDKMSGDKFHDTSWSLDREKQAIIYKGKEYSYDNE